MSAKRILGLDLANKIGICVIDSEKNLLYSDSIVLSKKNCQEKLLNLKKLLHDIVSKFQPNEFAIEDIFLPAKTSRKTPISLGELRGIARLSAAESDIPVFFYAPKKIKMAITGNGNASKNDVIHWIKAEFDFEPKDDNEADAVGIAYTHLLVRRYSENLNY